jgi:hypothetical protein
MQMESFERHRVHAAAPDSVRILQSVSQGTRLRVRMTYRVSTTFNWYASRIANLLVGNFETTALGFYAHRAELTAAEKASP